ncbi:MAG: glycerophosphodiester phosphodiesterase [Nocardioidaceae bacterium]
MKLVRLSAGAAVVLAASLLSAQGAQAADGSTTSFLRDSTPCQNKLISAHEGARHNADGDTLDSQKAAFRIGANIADTDVWETADNYMVEIHDEDVSHSTTGTGLISDMTIDTWGALRTTQYQEPIPTIEQTLALPQLPRMGRKVMMETKYKFNKWQRPDALSHLADKIKASGMDKKTIIYSQFGEQLKTLRQLDPALTLWYKPYDTLPSVATVLGYDANGVLLPFSLMTAKNVAKFHAAGLTVMRMRTPETVDKWNAFLATGADGLMTESPAKMIKWCRALG